MHSMVALNGLLISTRVVAVVGRQLLLLHLDRGRNRCGPVVAGEEAGPVVSATGAEIARGRQMVTARNAIHPSVCRRY